MSGCECRVCGYYHPGEGCVIDDALVSKLVRERDEARAEVERLRKSVEDWHDAAVRAERNAAMSQDENERLRGLLKQAVYHCESEGDDTLVAIINAAIDAAMQKGE